MSVTTIPNSPTGSPDAKGVEPLTSQELLRILIRKVVAPIFNLIGVAAFVLMIVNIACPITTIGTAATVVIGLSVAILAIAIAAGIIYFTAKDEVDEIPITFTPPSDSEKETPPLRPKPIVLPPLIIPDGLPLAERPVSFANHGQNNCCINSALQLIISDPYKATLLLNTLSCLIQQSSHRKESENLVMYQEAKNVLEQALGLKPCSHAIDTSAIRKLIEKCWQFNFNPFGSFTPTFKQHDAEEVISHLLYSLPDKIEIEGLQIDTTGQNTVLFEEKICTRNSDYAEPIEGKTSRDVTQMEKVEDSSTVFKYTFRASIQPSLCIKFSETKKHQASIAFTDLIESSYFAALVPDLSKTEPFRGFVDGEEYIYAYKACCENRCWQTPPPSLLLNFTRKEKKASRASLFASSMDSYFKVTTIIKDIPLKWRLKESYIKTSPPPTYDLKSFIVHEGSNPESGHYYAFRKKENGQWYKCDDALITKIEEEEVTRLLSTKTVTSLLYTLDSSAST